MTARPLRVSCRSARSRSRRTLGGRTLGAGPGRRGSGAIAPAGRVLGRTPQADRDSVRTQVGSGTQHLEDVPHDEVVQRAPVESRCTGAAPEGIVRELGPAVTLGTDLDRVRLPAALDEPVFLGPVGDAVTSKWPSSVPLQPGRLRSRRSLRAHLRSRRRLRTLREREEEALGLARREAVAVLREAARLWPGTAATVRNRGRVFATRGASLLWLLQPHPDVLARGHHPWTPGSARSSGSSARRARRKRGHSHRPSGQRGDWGLSTARLRGRRGGPRSLARSRLHGLRGAFGRWPAGVILRDWLEA